MADDIRFVIGVDNKDVLKAIKDNEILEKRIENLTKEYGRLGKAKNNGKISAVVYSKAINQVDSEIMQLQNTMKKGGIAVSQLASGMNVSGKSARRNEIAFQQAGYQVQDFIVQVQGGVNPLIAFSQQGSQLAGFFAGPWGAMIGLGIAAVSSLAMAFLSASEDAKRLEKSLDDIGDSLEDFSGMLEDAGETVSSFSYAMAQVQSTQIIAAWSKLGEDTAGAFEASFMAKAGSFLVANLWTGFETWGEISGRLSAESFAASFGTTVGVLGEGLLDDIGEAIKSKNIEYLDSTIESLSAFSKMTVEGARFLEHIINARDVANGFTAEVKDAADEIERASNYGENIAELDLKLGIDEARKVAELLAENMNISLAAAVGIVALAKDAMSLSPFGGEGDEFYSSSRKVYPSWDYDPKKKGDGGKGGSKESPQEKLAKYLADKEKELELETKLVGIFDTEREIQSELFKARDKYSGVITPAQEKELENTLRQTEAIKEQQTVLEEAKAQQEALAETISGAMGDAFMSIIDGTKSAGDAFKDMARLIISELIKILVIEKMVKSISGAISGAFGGGVSTNAISGPMTSSLRPPKMFADGGVVTRATGFGMSGGGSGVMGEAGPEAIMPLKRGANGKLGVQMEGGSGGGVNIVQHFNIAANGDDSVRKIIRQEAPNIANLTQKQIMDQRRRGGNMKSTFG